MRLREGPEDRDGLPKQRSEKRLVRAAPASRLRMDFGDQGKSIPSGVSSIPEHRSPEEASI